MKYMKEQRLDIGRLIYDDELTRYEAAEEYAISDETARNYMGSIGMSTDSRRKEEQRATAILPKTDVQLFEWACPISKFP